MQVSLSLSDTVDRVCAIFKLIIFIIEYYVILGSLLQSFNSLGKSTVMQTEYKYSVDLNNKNMNNRNI